MNSPLPPRLPRWLLLRCTRLRRHGEVVADLDELYAVYLRTHGPAVARLRYGFDVCSICLRPALRRVRSTPHLARGPIMLKNYLTITLRTLRKSPGFAFLNVAGLAVALACVLLIGRYALEERSYDRHFADAERVYRVALDVETQGIVQPFASVSATLAPALLADRPEVEAVTRLLPTGGATATVRVGDRVFYQDGMHRADASFFNFFGVPLLHGDTATALAEPGTVVLTRSTAEAWFGTTDVVGRTATLNGTDVAVSGVMPDLPEATHFRPSLLLPIQEWEGEAFMATWHLTAFHTYVKLRPGTDADAFAEAVRDFAYAYVGDEIEANRQTYAYVLQPLTDIHLHSDRRDELEANGRAATVYTFALIAAFILLIACINFMNLTTARALRRAKEVGVRKAVGARRWQLSGQFLCESVVMSAIATLLAVALARLLLPVFNQVAGTSLTLDVLGTPTAWALLGGLALVTGLLAGSYPAFALSRFRPASVLKGVFTAQKQGRSLRQGLVVFQFTVSIVLIVCTIGVGRQLAFLQSQSLGFDQEQVLVVPLRLPDRDTYDALRTELAAVPGVERLSLSTHVPGRDVSNNTMRRSDDTGRQVQMFIMNVDHTFLPTYDIPLIAGRNLSPDVPADLNGDAYVLNETAVRALGWAGPEDALGVPLRGYTGGTVVGVMADFHYESLHADVGPMMLLMQPRGFRYASLKLAAGAADDALPAVRARFATLLPDQPFDYFFLDDDFDQQYAAESQAEQLTVAFSLLAVLIACLGLFGLAAYAAELRTKEIGVRKVLGASVAGLVGLLSAEFLRLVAVAIVVAVPLAVVALNRYLDAFPYRVDVSAWTFVAAGALALLVAFLTVSVQALRAATADPVHALRYE